VLQEWALSRGQALPAYAIVSRTGSDHAPVFTVEVAVEGTTPAKGTGRSRQEAEKAAAMAMLKHEGLI
jgi:ribonuclease-3